MNNYHCVQIWIFYHLSVIRVCYNRVSPIQFQIYTNTCLTFLLPVARKCYSCDNVPSIQDCNRTHICPDMNYVRKHSTSISSELENKYLLLNIVLNFDLIFFHIKRKHLLLKGIWVIITLQIFKFYI